MPMPYCSLRTTTGAFQSPYTGAPARSMPTAAAQRPRAKLPGGSGRLSLVYAWPAGNSSIPEGPARRVSFSELLGSTGYHCVPRWAIGEDGFIVRRNVQGVAGKTVNGLYQRASPLGANWSMDCSKFANVHIAKKLE